MVSHTTLRFQLDLSAADFIAYYQGTIKSISVIADNGQRVEFAAKHLQPYLLHDGIHGQFVLTIDEKHRFVSLSRDEH